MDCYLNISSESGLWSPPFVNDSFKNLWCPYQDVFLLSFPIGFHRCSYIPWFLIFFSNIITCLLILITFFAELFFGSTISLSMFSFAFDFTASKNCFSAPIQTCLLCFLPKCLGWLLHSQACNHLEVDVADGVRRGSTCYPSVIINFPLPFNDQSILSLLVCAAKPITHLFPAKHVPVARLFFYCQGVIRV